MATLSDIRGSYRLTVQTGLTTTVAAATSSAGHIFSMQYVNAASSYTPAMRLRAFEVECITTTAFGSAQEVGFDLILARPFTAAPTGATAVTPLVTNDQKRYTSHPNSDFVSGGDIRVANTGAMTAGTMTLDSKPVVQGSFWSSAQGSQLTARRYDFSSIASNLHPAGILLGHQEGFVVRNTVLMGATGVCKWTFTVEWDEVTVTVK